jgi:hypothetical protein
MVSIKRVSINELDNLIMISYKDDLEGLEKYHIKPFTLEEAVYCTMKMVLDEAKEAKFIYYKILYNQKAIGYFVITNQVLFSFCINIHYRKPRIILEWWQKLEGLFGEIFLTAVYSNNTRALNFLIKRGMKVLSNENNIVKLIKTK